MVLAVVVVVDLTLLDDVVASVLGCCVLAKFVATVEVDGVPIVDVEAVVLVDCVDVFVSVVVALFDGVDTICCCEGTVVVPLLTGVVEVVVATDGVPDGEAVGLFID